jgi:hypothetical protein
MVEMEYDQIAIEAGLFVGISRELWMRDVSGSSAVFVEKGDVGYDCYRLVWYKAREDGIRRIAKEKRYVRGGSFNMAIDKAKSLISFYTKLK